MKQSAVAEKLMHDRATVNKICKNYKQYGLINKLYPLNSKLKIMDQRCNYIKNMKRWKVYKVCKSANGGRRQHAIWRPRITGDANPNQIMDHPINVNNYQPNIEVHEVN